MIASISGTPLGDFIIWVLILNVVVGTGAVIHAVRKERKASRETGRD